MGNDPHRLLAQETVVAGGRPIGWQLIGWVANPLGVVPVVPLYDPARCWTAP